MASGSTYRWLGAALLSAACAASPAATIGITPHSAMPVESATKPSTRAGPTGNQATSTLVVFGIERDGLLPIACFQPSLKRARGGVDCLDLVPEGETVVTDGQVRLVPGSHVTLAREF